MSHVLVVGSINTDLVVRGPRLPGIGVTVLGGEFFQAAGGKGANQAVAARRAGAEVTFLARVGADSFGNAAREGYAAEGIDVTFISVTEGAATGTALIMVDESGENMISVASGANHELLPADVDAIPDDVFASAKLLVASMEVPLPTVFHALQRARRAGMMTLVNPAPAHTEICCAEWLNLIDILTPNAAELKQLTGIEPRDPDETTRAVRKLQRLGCPKIVVTLGGRGCLVVDQSVQQIPAPQVKPVDATSAGDAFTGALAVALVEGKTLQDAAAWASKAAGLSVTKKGAQPSLPTRAEIDAFHPAS